MGRKQTIRIEEGDVHTIVADASNDVTVYSTSKGNETTLLSTVSASASESFGSYLNIVELNVYGECVITKADANFGTPIEDDTYEPDIAQSKVTGLVAALAAKLETGSAISDITDLQTTLDAKLETGSAISDITDLQTTLDAKLTADQGAVVADCSDAGTVITQLNALLAALRTANIIATA